MKIPNRREGKSEWREEVSGCLRGYIGAISHPYPLHTDEF